MAVALQRTPASTAAVIEREFTVRSRSQFQLAVRRFRRNRPRGIKDLSGGRSCRPRAS